MNTVTLYYSSNLNSLVYEQYDNDGEECHQYISFCDLPEFIEKHGKDVLIKYN